MDLFRNNYVGQEWLYFRESEAGKKFGRKWWDRTAWQHKWSAIWYLRSTGSRFECHWSKLKRCRTTLSQQQNADASSRPASAGATILCHSISSIISKSLFSEAANQLQTSSWLSGHLDHCKKKNTCTCISIYLSSIGSTTPGWGGSISIDMFPVDFNEQAVLLMKVLVDAPPGDTNFKLKRYYKIWYNSEEDCFYFDPTNDGKQWSTW